MGDVKDVRDEPLDPEPASALGVRICIAIKTARPTVDEARAVTELIEADRAAVRETELLACIAALRTKRDHYRKLAADAHDEVRHTMSRDARTVHEVTELLEARLSPSGCQVCDGSGYAPDPNYTGQAKMIMPCRACHPAWWQQMERERRGYGDTHSFPARRPARHAKVTP
jgi:hypothetical protein